MSSEGENWLLQLKDDLQAIELSYIGYLQLATGLIDKKEAKKEGWSDEDCHRIARLHAARAVEKVFQALADQPEFDGTQGLSPLGDIVLSFADLEDGNRPWLFSSRESVGKGGLSAKQSFIKVHAIAYTVALQASGAKKMDACKEVAKLLANAGFKGRKGGALSYKTIFDWIDRHTKKEAEGVQEILVEMREEMAWPVDYPVLVALFKSLLDHPSFQSKF